MPGVPFPANLKSIRIRFALSNKMTLLFMTIPCVIFILLFLYLPLLGWSIAFFDYQPGRDLLESRFVGFKYFSYAFHEPELLSVLRNTLVMSLLGIVTTPLPVFFAIFLAEMNSKKFRKFVQTTTTLPNFISWVLVFSISYAMFSTGDGMVNKLLLNLHIIKAPLNPLGNPDYVWLVQLLIYLWKTIGFSAIIYIAAIAGIDAEQYDAASVDGAGRFRKIWHITIPGLVPTYITLLLLGIGGLLNNGFEQYYLFYNGLVADKIQVLDYYLYRIGITLQNYPLSTALGITKTFVSIVLLTIANQIAKRTRGQSIL